MNPAATSNPPALVPPDLCHSLMERSPVPMAELEGIGHVLRYVNPAFCRLVGKSEEVLIGKPFADTVQEGDGCLALLDRVYRTGEAETHTESAHPEPHPAYWSYAMWPVLDAEQHPVGVMMQVTETTVFRQQTIAMNEALLLSSVRQHELTEASEKLNDQLQTEIAERKQAEEHLERINEDLKLFVYAASHDLQEPLRMVTSYTQLLAKKYAGTLDAEAQQFIATAVEGARRMEALLRGLREYWQVSERDGEHRTAVDCNQVLEETLRNLQAAMTDSGAVVTHDLLPPIVADEPLLGQLFQNLIGNALKYRSDRLPQIHVSAQAHEGQWRFAVQDNGLGIAPQHTDRIFGMFTRLHGHKYPGTGIGLALCRKLVERHGGRIWVESVPGQGSTFFFTLPVEEEKR